jgi:hypothetical protein
MLTIALLTSPVSAEAQSTARTARVGILAVAAPAPSDRSATTFLVPKALQEFGYVEGQNLVVERRFTGGQHERLPSLARDPDEALFRLLVCIPPSPQN